MDNMKHLYKDAGDRVLSIDYDDLVSNPEQNLLTIETFLDLPKHDYDLNNLTNEFHDRNIIPFGPKGMHRVRPKFEKTSMPAEEVLGTKLYNFYSEIGKTYYE